MRAPTYAQRTLEAGFTTVRDVGAGEYIDIALRDAINDGTIAGPRMLVATLPISATGGHGDLNGFSPYLRSSGFSGIADGVDEIRKRVRENVKRGADLIKVLAGAGVLSEEESAGAPQYSQEELNALVSEAAMWGRKVAAHAHGTEAIRRAVEAGVASVEHGGLVDEETRAADGGEGDVPRSRHPNRRLHPRARRRARAAAEDHRQGEVRCAATRTRTGRARSRPA